MEEEVIAKIKNQIKEFYDEKITLIEGCSFGQYDILKRILLYNNSKFESGNTDSEGFEKHFYNVNKFRCQVCTKATDIDTKDIDILAEEGQSYYPCWFFEKEFRHYMKEEGFAELLNRLEIELPIFGSVVLKDVNGKLKIVDLRNLINKQDADNLQDANYVIEKHYYLPEELRSKDWNKEAIDKVINEYRKGEGEGYIEVFEAYGYYPESQVKEGGDKNKYIKARFIVSGLEKKDKSENEQGEQNEVEGTVLDKMGVDKFPYWELHWTRVPGRWLGKGVVEELFGAQVRVNEVVNLKAKGLWWTSLKIYQTRDQQIEGNILQDAVHGKIFNVQQNIEPIVNEERNLATFETEVNNWENLMNKQIFTYESITGERAPAGTPLGSMIIQNRMASGFFDFQRENLGLFIKKIIKEIIIPQFQKKQKAEHILNLIGENPDELKKFEQLVFNQRYNQRMIEWLKEKQDIPNYQEANMLEMAVSQSMKKEDHKFPVIPKSFYDNLKYKINIVITGETIDTNARLQILQTVLQLVGSNPMILKDEQTKRVFYKLLDAAGINPADFEITPDVESQEDQMTREVPRGGSVARPPSATMPAVMPSEKKV